MKFSAHKNLFTFAILSGRTSIYLIDFQVSCHLISCTTEFTTIHLSGGLGFSPKFDVHASEIMEELLTFKLTLLSENFTILCGPEEKTAIHVPHFV